MTKLPTKAVKGIIKKDDGTILLLERRKKPGDIASWDLPGGLCEANESETETLEREIREELGIEVVISEPAGTWSFVRPYDEQIVTAHNYLCHLKNADAPITLSDEHVDYTWITPEEIARFPLKDKSLAKCILRKNSP